MYSVYLTNFGYVKSSHGKFEEAMEAGKQTGYEFSIWFDGVLVGFYTLFGGWREA